MNTTARRRGDLLADSEATLRQVRAVVRELDGDEDGGPVGPGRLLEILLEAYSELVVVIDGLRQSRSSLNKATLARLQHTHEKLAEVSSTTELAATDLLDRLDQALDFLDRLDRLDAADAAGEATDVREERATLRGEIRDRLDHAVILLQFQDITSQQLGYASGVLTDVESRLAAVADVLAEGSGLGRVEAGPEPDPVEEPVAEQPSVPAGACDPNATSRNSESRQALADEIFGIA